MQRHYIFLLLLFSLSCKELDTNVQSSSELSALESPSQQKQTSTDLGGPMPSCCTTGDIWNPSRPQTLPGVPGGTYLDHRACPSGYYASVTNQSVDRCRVYDAYGTSYSEYTGPFKICKCVRTLGGKIMDILSGAAFY